MIEYTNTITPITILEIGSRDGDDSELLRKDFNVESENVWVVEPNPTQQIKIVEKYPRINLIKNPIFNIEKNITFYGVDVEDQILNGVSSLMNRIDGLYDKINTNKIEVKTMSGLNLLKLVDTEIDICKIDVEGATYEVLESFGDNILLIKSMHIECEHRAVWVNQKLYESVSEYLTSKGFSQVYFKYCNNDTLQSDSIWVQTKYLK